MTADEVRRALRVAASAAGGMQAWTIANGVNTSYAHDVLAGRREPGGKILDALGLVMVRPATAYRPAVEPPTSLLQSQFDMTNQENVKQAEFEMVRCVSDYDWKRWGSRFGAALVEYALTDESADTIADLESKLDDAEDAADSEAAEKNSAIDEAADLENAITAAIERLEPMADGRIEIQEIIADLRDAI